MGCIGVRILSVQVSTFSTWIVNLMRRFRSLLIDQVDVRMPGLRLLKLAVHRHLAEHASVELHRHRWSQALLYLSGRGRQLLAGGDALVEPGTLVVMPPGAAHAFTRTTERAPLCLMLDFRLQGLAERPMVVCSLNRSELAQVRQQLAQLIRLQAEVGGSLRWEGAAVGLQLLVNLLRIAGWLERAPAALGTGSGRALRQLLAKIDPANPLRRVVQQSGYQRDHLNRLVKKETGLTLGQFRAQRRLARAKELLAQGLRVATVAAAVGLPDQNYFARWFRRQTGLRPSTWIQGGLGRAAAGSTTPTRGIASARPV